MDLQQCRARINEIDDQIADLFKERMDVSLDVAKYKQKHYMNILNKAREREIVDRVTHRVGDELAIYAKILFNTLFDLSRSRQVKFIARKTELEADIRAALEKTPQLFPQKAVVACQGVEGAYSQQACDRLFALPSIMYLGTFDSVFQAVDLGLCHYGILPIENSSYGSVNEVYDLMKKYKFYIARSIKLEVNHALLARPGVKLEDITEIYSHGQAIGQCSEFLTKNKHIKVTPCANTAVAAKLVAESGRRDVAAISSHNCAELYGLSDLGVRVQNADGNFTRFICITKELEIFPGASKISLMMPLPHTPGSLNFMLAKFSSLGLNLCKLESRPIPGTDFSFMFYFDIGASVYSDEVLRLLSDIEGGYEQVDFLGAYSEL